MTQQLGPYRLDAEIGAGSMGAVYRAFDPRLNRVVAIKLWQHDSSSVQASPRMLKEARAASALNHPNIVVVHDFGETPTGDAYIVQEFIEGETLRKWLGTRLPIPHALDIGTQVARALAAAHAIGVVHRDIKPENVMVRADGYVKVLDFGIAHLPKPIEGDSGLTGVDTLANYFLGTPAYMSPEAILGEAIGPPADVFALGVMLYELITGVAPLTAPTVASLVMRIVNEVPPSMGSIDTTIPAGVDTFILSMMDKDPQRRPTALEVERVLPMLSTTIQESFTEEVEGAGALTVGREQELALLTGHFERVRGGASAIVGVSGEPGIGKSTVLESFMRSLRKMEEPMTVVRVRCSESLAGSESYLPVLEALDHLRTRSRSSFDVLMRTVAPTWHAMVSAADGDDRSGAAASQERMKRELRAFLVDASRRAPLVWLIEDLHWADASTIDILNYVANRFDEMRVMIVVAFRPTDMSISRHPFLSIRTELKTKGCYDEIALRFLSREDVAHYLALRWPVHRFPDSFVREIHARTEGSPLFMSDVVRYLHDTGVIHEEDGVWTAARSHVDSTRDLPESVRGMIARKIERVDELDRKILLAASTQGEEFDSAPVADALEMDAADVEDRLTVLESVHGFVHRSSEVEYPDASFTLRYRFVHVLYQNELYASLQPSRRVSLCSRTAQSMVRHHASEVAAIAGRIAVLFEAARDFAAAGQYFYLAVQRAVSLFGFREALTLADRGLAGVLKLPESPQRHQLELALQMMRGLALRSVRGWAAAELEPTFARARELVHLLNDSPALFPVLWNLAFFNAIRGNSTAVQEQLEVLTAQATASGDASYIIGANHLAGVAFEFLGDLETSHRIFEELYRLHDPAHHLQYTALYGVDPGMIGRAMSARTMWAMGIPDQAIARSRETIAMGKTQRQPMTYVFSLIVGSSVHLARGEFDEVILLCDEVTALCQEYEFAQEIEWGRGFQGYANVRVGNEALGMAQMQQSLSALAALKSGLARTLFLSLHVDALARAGKLDEGFAVLEEGLAFAHNSLEKEFLHEFHRVRGELLAQRGERGEAEAAMREAVAICRATKARSYELRALTSLVRLLGPGAAGSAERMQLAECLASFTEGHDTVDHRAARAILG